MASKKTAITLPTPAPASSDSGDSDIVVVAEGTLGEEVIASDRRTVDRYIRDWGPFDPYLRVREEVAQ